MKFYTLYNPPPKGGTSFDGEESLTQTQFKNQCDLNLLIARLQRGDTSMLKHTGVYYDTTNIPSDLQSALQVQINARDIWSASEDVRARFGTVENLLDFLSFSDNREEAIKLGLIQAPVNAPETASSAVSSPNGAEDSNPKSAQ